MNLGQLVFTWKGRQLLLSLFVHGEQLQSGYLLKKHVETVKRT